jgi:hypothetical protein
MAKIAVHGGDFVAGESGTFTFGVLTLPTAGPSFLGIPLTKREEIPLSKVMRIEAVNKEMKHRTGVAVGRGAVAAMIAGPIGSVGAVLGGPTGIAVAVTSAIIGFNTTNHTSNVTFEAEFEGGRRLLATTNTATYTKLLAAAFDYKPPQQRAGLAFNQHEPERKVEGRLFIKFLPFILASYVLIGMINGSPLAWGVAVGAAVFFFGRKIVENRMPPTIQAERQSPEPKL